MIGRLQAFLGPRLRDPQAVWVLDGSDFPEQGLKSVGAERQYCGILDKIANCQTGMFLAHVGPRSGPWWISVCTCPKPSVRMSSGTTGRRRNWCWRCWYKFSYSSKVTPYKRHKGWRSGVSRSTATCWIWCTENTAAISSQINCSNSRSRSDRMTIPMFIGTFVLETSEDIVGILTGAIIPSTLYCGPA